MCILHRRSPRGWQQRIGTGERCIATSAKAPQVSEGMFNKSPVCVMCHFRHAFELGVLHIYFVEVGSLHDIDLLLSITGLGT